MVQCNGDNVVQNIGIYVVPHNGNYVVQGNEKHIVLCNGIFWSNVFEIMWLQSLGDIVLVMMNTKTYLVLQGNRRIWSNMITIWVRFLTTNK